MKKKVLRYFKDEFEVNQIITQKEIERFLETYYGKLKKATLAWRIYDLKKSNYIFPVGNQRFKVLDPKKYQNFSVDIEPNLKDDLKQFNAYITNVKKRFTDEENVNICVWNTSILNNYSVLQLQKHYTIVEIDQDRIEKLATYLMDKYKNVLISKKNNYITHYLNKEIIIIDRLPKRSPLNNKRSTKNNFVSTPKIEKLMVDIIVYQKHFLPLDDHKISVIYKNIFDQHVVDVKKLLNYARVRGVKTREAVERHLEQGEDF